MQYNDQLLAVLFGDDLLLDQLSKASWCWKYFEKPDNILDFEI